MKRIPVNLKKLKMIGGPWLLIVVGALSLLGVLVSLFTRRKRSHAPQPGTDTSANPLTIKICCIQNVQEARLALKHGANYLGLVSAMPSGPGPISDDEIADIVSGLEDARPTVLLTSLNDVDMIVRQQGKTGARVLQLCTRLSSNQLRELRVWLPNIKLMPVVHVSGPEAVTTARELAPHADMLLLDSGSPNAKVPVLGGTGKTHDWDISAEIVRSVRIPVFLAGGLTPDNVADAIKRVRPAGVDICSGVRSNGALDEKKLARYIKEVRSSRV